MLATAALESLIPWSGPIIRYRPDPSFCLDLPGGDTTVGRHLWVWKCDRLINQGWVLWGGTAAIASAADNSKCLTLDAPTDIIIASCHNPSAANQQWGWDRPSGAIVYQPARAGNKQCITIDGSLKERAKVSLQQCATGKQQTWDWDFTLLPFDGPTIRPRTDTSMCVDIPGGDTTSGTRLQLCKKPGSNPHTPGSCCALRSFLLQTPGIEARPIREVQRPLQPGLEVRQW